ADEDFTQSGDEQLDADLSSENDLVLVASHEGNSIYNFDEHDLPSSSTDSGCETSELYDFRLHHHRPTSSTTTGIMPSTTAPALDDHLPSHSEPDLDDDEDHDLDGAYTAILHPSPRFDAKTGWFSGSIDEFHGFLKGANGGPRQMSRASPVLRPEDSAGLSGQGIDELVLEDYLGRYGDGGGGRRGGDGEGV
ncbi:hypothetical protein KC315_g20150, partial [Hortaea werneckii]